MLFGSVMAPLISLTANTVGFPVTIAVGAMLQLLVITPAAFSGKL
jgi:hypothetical protein